MAAAPHPRTPPADARREPVLLDCVTRVVRRHLADGVVVDDLLHVVLAEVERPLLVEVMAHVAGNQSRAADLLGVSRATLRKKLREHGLSTS